MPLNNFSLGKDTSIQITTQFGLLNLPPTTTGFDSKPQYNNLRSIGLDGTNRGAAIPTGWTGTIKIDRSNNAIDAYFAQAEAAYYAGQNLQNGTILETIRESNGAISQYRYTGVCLSFEDAGNKTGDNKVEQSVGFFASQRIQIA